MDGDDKRNNSLSLKNSENNKNINLNETQSLPSSALSKSSASPSSSLSSSSSTSSLSSIDKSLPKQLPSSLMKCHPLPVKDLNEWLSCRLCRGYLIDATTIVECLHSFCRTCLITHLDSLTPKSRFCPACDAQIHKTKPKLNIRSDPTLQDIVYKLVPGLFKNEMNRRKEFYSKEPRSAIGLSSEERGEMSGERLIFTPEDIISLSIEYFPQVISYSLLPFSKCLGNGALNCDRSNDSNTNQRRYLRCQGAMRVLHLKKWLRLKYDVKDDHDIDIMYKHDPLCDDYTMMDLAYIYSWRRNGPLCLYYKIFEPQKQKEESNKFLTPQIIPIKKHTVKHRHRPQLKRKLSEYESNLITTNPVNEPLPPVDNTLINSVINTVTMNESIDLCQSSKGNNNAKANKRKINANRNNGDNNKVKCRAKPVRDTVLKSAQIKKKNHAQVSVNNNDRNGTVDGNGQLKMNGVKKISNGHMSGHSSLKPIERSNKIGTNKVSLNGLIKESFTILDFDIKNRNNVLPLVKTVPLPTPSPLALPFMMTPPMMINSLINELTNVNNTIGDNEVALNLSTSKGKDNTDST